MNSTTLTTKQQQLMVAVWREQVKLTVGTRGSQTIRQDVGNKLITVTSAVEVLIKRGLVTLVPTSRLSDGSVSTSLATLTRAGVMEMHFFTIDDPEAKQAGKDMMDAMRHIRRFITPERTEALNLIRREKMQYDETTGEATGAGKVYTLQVKHLIADRMVQVAGGRLHLTVYGLNMRNALALNVAHHRYDPLPTKPGNPFVTKPVVPETVIVEAPKPTVTASELLAIMTAVEAIYRNWLTGQNGVSITLLRHISSEAARLADILEAQGRKA